MSLAGHTSAVECVSFDSNEQTVIAGSAGGTLKLWDLEQAKVARTLTGHRSNCISVQACYRPLLEQSLPTCSHPIIPLQPLSPSSDGPGSVVVTMRSGTLMANSSLLARWIPTSKFGTSGESRASKRTRATHAACARSSSHLMGDGSSPAVTTASSSCGTLPWAGARSHAQRCEHSQATKTLSHVAQADRLSAPAGWCTSLPSTLRPSRH